MGRTNRDPEPTDGFMDQEFARFREERLKARGRPAEPTTTEAPGDPPPPPTPAPPEEHLDGADDGFARFRAARLRDGGRPSGRMRSPVPPAPANEGDVPLEPARSTRTRTALEAGIEAEGAPGGALLEPHAKASIAPVAQPAHTAVEPAAPAPAPPPAEPAGAVDFDHFRAQRAANRQIEPTVVATTAAPDDGMFFGTSSQERRSVGARVRESRTDLSADVVAALVILDEAASQVEKTPPHGLEKTPPHGLEKTPPHGLEKTPPHGRRRAPPPLPARESA